MNLLNQTNMSKSESGRSSSLNTLKREIYSSLINDDIDCLDSLLAGFSDKPRSQLFNIIYESYNEAALRNVPLSDKIKLKVEVYLIDLYPYGNDSTCWSVILVQQKITEMRKKMDELKCYNYCTVDQRFLYVMTSLALDIHVLKRLLKSSYKRLPWEEVEFCVAVFVLSRRNINETNLYCHAYLSVERILAHLGHFIALLESFGDSLDTDTDLSDLAKMPENLRRDDVIKVICERTPETTLLYEDFNRLRDIHSLDIINSHLDLVRSSDPMELGGRLVILRSLQVVGEHIKNTLVTPKLSQDSVDLIINTMKKYTWNKVKQIRDKISHKLLEIIPIVSDLDLFVKLKHDLEKTGDMVRGLLNRLKLKSYTAFINKFNMCLNSDKSNEVWDCLDFIDAEKFDEIINSYNLSKTKLESMVKQLTNSFASNKSKIVLDEIYGNTHSNVRQYELIHYNKFLIVDSSLTQMKQLKHIRHEPQLQRLIIKSIRILKAWDDIYKVQEMRALDLESHLLKEEPILNKCINNVTADYNSVKSIDALGEKCERSVKRQKPKITNDTELTKYWMFFEDKLELRNSTALIKLKGDAVALVLMELYILLKLSYLEKDSLLPDSVGYFDKYPKILTGNCLRNQVAHNNIINEILQLDTTVTLIANAISLYNVSNANMSESAKTIEIFKNYEHELG